VPPPAVSEFAIGAALPTDSAAGGLVGMLGSWFAGEL
jgi:hypothetical protein